MVIRARRPGDVAFLCDVLAEQQPSSRYPFRWPMPFPVERFIVRDHELGSWVAEIDGRVAGHVSVTAVTTVDDISSPWCAAAGTGITGLGCVSVLFVGLDTKGLGVGGRLLDTAVQCCRELGLVPVLDVLQSSSGGGAAAVYRHRGWQTVGEVRMPWLPAEEPPMLLMILPPPPLQA